MSGYSDAPSYVGAYFYLASSAGQKGTATSGGCARRKSGIVGIRSPTKQAGNGFDGNETSWNGCLYMDEGACILEETDDGGRRRSGLSDVARVADGGIVMGNVDGIYRDGSYINI